MGNEKPGVVFFQRKTREVGNYSVEIIFDDVRSRLKNQIDSTTYFSKFTSKGFFKRFYNCIEAFFRQGRVNHVTGDVNYLGLMLSKKRTIHTILDCVFLNRSTGIRHRVLKLFWLTIPVRRSIYLTAISQSTKNEILKYSKCEPEKIIVIPVAISERFARVDKPFNKLKPIILQIGTAENKNIPRLIEALKGISCELHIVGKFIEEYKDLLDAAKIDYIYQSGLSDDQMIKKYIDADIISFASTYEGFGMPILEAQTVGRVVVTANVYSMPEVAGVAACIVDPFNEMSIRSGISKVIQDDAYREDLITKGFQNTLRYKASYIASQYYDLYKKVYTVN